MKLDNKIIIIRDKKVILDRDLAELCQVETKVLNQNVKRNIELFSDDRFQLNQVEKQEVVTNCDHLKMIRFSSNLPFAFTQLGAEMVVRIMKKDIDLTTLFYEIQPANSMILNDDLRTKIHNIRNLQVILDFDLAFLYQVETKRLKQTVKRHVERFPIDFMFQLNNDETNLMVSQNAIPSKSHLGGIILLHLQNKE